MDHIGRWNEGKAAGLRWGDLRTATMRARNPGEAVTLSWLGWNKHMDPFSQAEVQPCTCLLLKVNRAPFLGGTQKPSVCSHAFNSSTQEAKAKEISVSSRPAWST